MPNTHTFTRFLLPFDRFCHNSLMDGRIRNLRPDYEFRAYFRPSSILLKLMKDVST